MLRTTLFFLGLISFLLISCENETRMHPKIENTQSITVERFELAFTNTAIPLEELKLQYPYLFPAQTPDSVWKKKRTDSLELLLIKAVDSVFGNFQKQQQELNRLFSYYNYYFPKTRIPMGITLTTNIDYFSRVIYTDSLLLMGLDNFLGEHHPYYQNFPNYLKTQMTPDDLIHDIAKRLAQKQIPINKQNTFLSKIIQEGKLLYLQELLTPNYSKAKRLGYTNEQFGWAELNEAQIWRYFIDNELLYSTERELDSRFITVAPFSKFELSIDRESPGSIGRYLGYQLVSSYMEHNSISVDLLFNRDAVTILKNAKYKPKKH